MGTEDGEGPLDIDRAREDILEGIHRAQALVGETQRLILNPTAEPPAIAAPAVLAELKADAEAPAVAAEPKADAEPEIPNPAKPA